VRTLFAAKQIHIGLHPQAHLFGLTIDTDIVLSTLVAAAIYLYMGFWLARKGTSGVPGKLQAAYEWILEQVTEVADSAIGPESRRFIPVGMTLFFFILICNWLDFIPTAMHPGSSEPILPAPTSDVNLPLAMALFVIVWVHVESFRARKVKGYFKHYFQPFKAMAPINAIEEFTKPITMTFRLFGNLFSGGLMVVVMVALLPFFTYVPFQVGWELFDTGLLGLVQAFIFMLLTIIYFGMAMSHEEAPVGQLELSH
jgi:F-type H+-transporting ATPase subunit a